MKRHNKCHKQWSHYLTSQIDVFADEWRKLAKKCRKRNKSIFDAQAGKTKKPHDPSLPLVSLIANVALLDEARSAV